MLLVEQDDNGVGRIVLDRPEARNALTIEMRDGITEAVRELRRSSVRAVMITGAGDAFCAGMDLSASTVAQAGRPGFTTRSVSEALRAGVQTFVRELWELDKPTVAAVNGAAVGAHLALACDFVLVHSGAIHVDVPEVGPRRRCRRRVLLPGSSAPPRRSCCSARRSPARERSTSGSRTGASRTPTLAAAAEKVVRHARTDSLPWPLEAAAERVLRARPRRLAGLEGSFQALASSSADLVEGMAAFTEKRTAASTADDGTASSASRTWCAPTTATGCCCAV